MRPDHLRRRLAAVCMIDVAGYSRLMGMDDAQTLLTLRAFQSEIAHPMAELNGGRVVNWPGDSILLDFDSAEASVRFAIGVQRAIHSRNQSVPADRQMRFRVGINLGEVIVEGDGLFGDPVNVAARVEGLCEPGGVCATREVVAHLRPAIAALFEDRGTHRGKNIAADIRVFGIAAERISELADVPDPVANLLRDGPAAKAPGPAPAGKPIRLRAKGLRRAESPDDGQALETTTYPSIVVLPLTNGSGDRSEQYFADGITDDIITRLTRFRNLDVIARRSAFRFRGRGSEISTIGRKLNSQYVARGMVRRQGSRMLCSVQLHDAASERVIWAERFERPFEDVFDVQDEISELIVAGTAATIEEAERSRVREARPHSLDAYGQVLRAQSHLFRYTNRENEFARAWYERAISLDPGYARAYAGLSRTHSHAWRHGWTAELEASMQNAISFAEQAVSHDANDARGLAELGYVRLYSREHELSIRAYQRALELNPNDADIIVDYADALRHSGQPEKALPFFERAMRLNPFCPDVYLLNFAGTLFQLKRFDETIAAVGRMSIPSVGRRLHAAALGHLGRTDEARQVAARLLAEDPSFSISHWAKVVPEKRPEDLELFVSGLEKAGLPRHSGTRAP
jgi:TolB-like protein/class 3 adenylate cyclase